MRKDKAILSIKKKLASVKDNEAEQLSQSNKGIHHTNYINSLNSD